MGRIGWYHDFWYDHGFLWFICNGPSWGSLSESSIVRCCGTTLCFQLQPGKFGQNMVSLFLFFQRSISASISSVRLLCHIPFIQYNGITDTTKAHNSSTNLTVTSFVGAVFISSKWSPSSLPRTGDEIAWPSRNIPTLKKFSHTFHLYLVQGLFFKGFASFWV